ncbi:hypothetical protein AGDE_16799 [Angomonas deanei]|uniref:Uncharacterized protein n=1 Tax=Angomonas deanei TaxID=59799 RepID=A0A7G2CK53_9TRYP|nr:hypothetical protein AGDE_16799 [Angomonas deanei]CAD2219274.1 hypothetical protein, conserved [Angomonas deanei]|eukprot:EPY16173.1 hypothetical protein AGDE_16799 [Angomonas deanei]
MLLPRWTACAFPARFTAFGEASARVCLRPLHRGACRRRNDATTSTPRCERRLWRVKRRRTSSALVRAELLVCAAFVRQKLG